MNLAHLDNLAYQGKGLLHRASTLSKIVMVVVILANIIIHNRPWQLTTILALLIVGMILANLPLKEILHFAIAPLFFALFFAVGFLESNWSYSLTIILKALCATLTVLLLMFSTPYGEVFAFFSLFLPTILIDSLFLTYRSFFILLEELEHFILTIKLKGGYTPSRIFSNVKNIGSGLGIIFIRALEMAERMYKIMLLRWYRGGIKYSGKWYRLNIYDLFPLGLSLIITYLVVIMWNGQ